jgi:peptidylprolyl isomerase
MKQVSAGDNVKVHYKGTFDDGTVFDSSLDCDPLEFTIGGCQVIPGFEEAVMGMRTGETKTVRINSDMAYGPHNEEMVVVFGRISFLPILSRVSARCCDSVVMTVTLSR